MDTDEQILTNKDGENLLLEGHSSSTPLAHTDEPPIATDLDLTSLEVTVETSPSNHQPENKIKPPTVQQETPARSPLTPMPGRAFSCLDPPYFVPDTFGFIPPPISRRHTYPAYNQLHGVGKSSNYGYGYSSSGADVMHKHTSYWNVFSCHEIFICRKYLMMTVIL